MSERRQQEHASESLAQRARRYRLPEDSPWAKAPLVAAVLGGLGLLGSLYGWVAEPERFGFSYLFALLCVLTVALGALFFVMVLHLTVGAWGVSVRRTAELLLSGLPLLALLALPLLVVSNQPLHLYEWARFEAEQHAGEQAHASHDAAWRVLPVASAQEHAAAEAEGGSEGAAAAHAEEPEQLVHHRLLEHKSGWLSLSFWKVRALLYLAVWLLLGWLYLWWSTRQDETADPALTRRMQKLAAPGLVLLGLSLTFAAFDWVMSLLPAWYSTIFGVYVFAGSAVAVLAAVTALAIVLQEQGAYGEAVHVEHFHDLGKLLFGFVCFWAYIGFSQWMLIWYAGIPEEVAFFHQRRGGGWSEVGALLIVGHFVLPFFYLISRVPKRRPRALLVGALWMLLMHVVDVYWLVLPAYSPGRLQVHWLDAACLLAVGGLFLAVVFSAMRRYSLVPVGDPRLPRSVHFVQTQ